MLWGLLLPFQTCPLMRSMMIIMQTNTFHHDSVVQETNGLVLTLFFSMTVTLMAATTNHKNCVDANPLDDEDVGMCILNFFGECRGSIGRRFSL